jgi:hypothetical protein
MRMVRLTVGEAVRLVERTGHAAEFCPDLRCPIIRPEAADALCDGAPPHVAAVVTGVQDLPPSRAWSGVTPTSEIYQRIREALTEPGCAVRPADPPGG